eukprot:TRINITY_DN2031_c0_g1_i3.p1 TRINITY_DN2031_c0_g1~~TRINITY_DN2031_c0_g1_i3.p1  ORF type:complete len:538 (+),score=226.88 TRINITY_DN2031_c0_g1_i3:55-1614(+)
MKVITGDEIGFIKVVHVEKKTLLHRFGTPNRSKAIIMMKWASLEGPNGSQFLVLRKDNTIELIDYERKKVLHTITGYPDKVVGMEWLHVDKSTQSSTNANKNKKGKKKNKKGKNKSNADQEDQSQKIDDGTRSMAVMTVTESGLAHLHHFDYSIIKKEESNQDDFADDDKMEALQQSVVDFGDEDDEENTNVLRVGKDITVLRLQRDGREYPSHTMPADLDNLCFAIAGKEQEVNLWSWGTRQCLWKAKNVPHDFLDLRVPVWVTDLQFIPNHLHKIIITTGYHQIRVYDTTLKRRPILNVEVGVHKFNMAKISHSGQHIYTGDRNGYIRKIDVNNGIVYGAYKYITGSVRDVELHPDPEVPYIASVSLDRVLRLHSLDTRELVHKIYLKQQLTSILFTSEEEEQVNEDLDQDDYKQSSSSAKQEDESDDEMDDTWNALDIVGDSDDDDEEDSDEEDSDDDTQTSSKRKRKQIKEDSDDEEDESDSDNDGEEDQDSSSSEEEQKEQQPQTRRRKKPRKK